MTALVWILIVLFVLFVIVAKVHDDRAGITQRNQTRKLQEAARLTQVQREREQRIVCPHCHTAGQVKSAAVKLKKGISGGKATGAILTGGLSVLGTGLSRKEDATQMHCGNCSTTWTV